MGKQIQEQRVRTRLQEYATRDVPDNLSIWPAIYDRIQQPSGHVLAQPTTSEHSESGGNSRHLGHIIRSALPGSAQRRRQPVINLGLAGLVALIMAVGVAAVTLWMLPPTEGLNRDTQGNFGSVYSQAAAPIRQTINGYTVNLFPSYSADNHIVITYIVTDPQGNNVPVYKLYQDAMHIYYQGDPTGSKGAPKLSDDLGGDAPWMGSRFAWSNPSGPEEEAPISDIEAHMDKAACCLNHADVMWLDFVPPTNGEPPAVGNLHLELPVFLPEAVLTPVAESKASTSPTPTLTKLNYGNVVDARLSFDFPLKSDAARRVIEVNQAVEAAGVTVTLEKVVVTPRDTFVALHYGEGSDGREYFPQSMQLSAGNWTSGIVTRKDGIFFVPLQDQQGEWVLTVTELFNWDTTTQPFEQTILNGPWVFKFTVPPALLATP